MARTLSVTATYLLSEDGRKASLLAGGDGHAVQQIALQVPANRLHLVSVDKQGVARLKLGRDSRRDGERGVVRIDAAPLYDAPPTIDDLYRAAAKNHELETRLSMPSASPSARSGSDADRARRESVARGLPRATRTQRAVAHPPPSPKRCYVMTERGRLLFDVATDQGLAKEVPPEAHRRFRADLRAQGRTQSAGPSRSSSRSTKRRSGSSPSGLRRTAPTNRRRARPPACFRWTRRLKAITDQAFAVDRPTVRSTRATAPSGCRRSFAKSRGLADTVVDHADVAVRSVQRREGDGRAVGGRSGVCRALMPDANVVLREHVLSSKRHHESPSLDGVRRAGDEEAWAVRAAA